MPVIIRLRNDKIDSLTTMVVKRARLRHIIFPVVSYVQGKEYDDNIAQRLALTGSPGTDKNILHIAYPRKALPSDKG